MSKNFTVDNNTFATNPGNASLNPFIWFLHDLRNIFLLINSLFFTIALAVLVSGWFYILFFLAIAINVLYWLRKKEHFKSGDSNGGIVVSVKPDLVAITTDLTKGFGEYPVVKIIKGIDLVAIKLGDRIPTVALYSASTDDQLPHWIDFNPLPLSYATRNKKVLQNALDSYGDEYWMNLEKRIEEIPQPYKEGLHKVELESSGWKAYAN